MGLLELLEHMECIEHLKLINLLIYCYPLFIYMNDYWD